MLPHATRAKKVPGRGTAAVWSVLTRLIANKIVGWRPAVLRRGGAVARPVPFVPTLFRATMFLHHRCRSLKKWTWSSWRAVKRKKINAHVFKRCPEQHAVPVPGCWDCRAAPETSQGGRPRALKVFLPWTPALHAERRAHRAICRCWAEAPMPRRSRRPGVLQPLDGERRRDLWRVSFSGRPTFPGRSRWCGPTSIGQDICPTPDQAAGLLPPLRARDRLHPGRFARPPAAGSADRACTF